MSDMDLEYTQARNNQPTLMDQARERAAAAQEPDVPQETFGERFAAVAGEVGETALQIPIGLREGFRQQARAIEGVLDELDIPSVVQLTDPETGEFDLDLVTRAEAGETSILFPETDRPEGFAPNLARSAGQFVSGFAGPFKILKGAIGTGKAVLASGAIADAFAFDPDEPTASEFLETTGLANPVTEFLATDADDSEAEKRFKNAVEGALLGKIGQKLTEAVTGTFRALRAGKGVSTAAETAEIAAKESEATLKRIQEKVSAGGETAVVSRPRPAVSDPDALDAPIEFTDLNDPVPEKAVNINLSKLDTPDDVKNVIAQVATEFEGDIQKARRGKITLEQTEALADDLGLTVEQLMSRRQGEAFNAETVFAARKILVSSAEQVRALARVAQGTDASAEDKAAFLQAMSTHKGIQQQVSGLTAEAGRALSAFRIQAGRDINVVLDSVQDVSEVARKIATQDTLQGVNIATRNAEKATTKDMLLEVWINGLLSGPTTHMVNLTSNAMVNLWAVPDRMLAVGFGKIFPGQNEVATGEVVEMLYGMANGYKDGLKLGWKALRTGEAIDPLTKLEIRKQKAISGENLDLVGPAGRAVDFLGETIRLPGRFLTAGDELFKSVNYRMELQALAHRQARQEGLDGRNLASRITEIVNDPPAQIVEDATQFARVQTFTNQLGETGRAIQNVSNSHPAAKLLLPFVRTPTNIMKTVGVKSPLAPFAKSVRSDMFAGGARRDLALAKMSTGSMIMSTAAMMASEGRISGGGPANFALRRLLRDTGWQPYSIKIGETWFSYNRLDPIGMTIGLGADYAEIIGNVDEFDGLTLASTVALATAKNVASKTYVRGLTDVLGALDQVSADPNKENASFERYIARLGSTFVPFTSLLSTIERQIDPTLRSADGFIQTLKARTPGYSADLPPVLNMWGQEVILGGGLGPDIISPIYVSHTKESPVSAEMFRLKLPMGMPQKSMSGVRLEPQEYHDFVKTIAESGVEGNLKTIINSRVYRNSTSDGPEGQKAATIRSMIEQSRQAAREQIKFGRDPQFQNLRQRMKEAEAKQALGG